MRQPREVQNQRAVFARIRRDARRVLGQSFSQYIAKGSPCISPEPLGAKGEGRRRHGVFRPVADHQAKDSSVHARVSPRCVRESFPERTVDGSATGEPPQACRRDAAKVAAPRGGEQRPSKARLLPRPGARATPARRLSRRPIASGAARHHPSGARRRAPPPRFHRQGTDAPPKRHRAATRGGGGRSSPDRVLVGMPPADRTCPYRPRSRPSRRGGQPQPPAATPSLRLRSRDVPQAIPRGKRAESLRRAILRRFPECPFAIADRRSREGIVIPPIAAASLPPPGERRVRRER